MDKIIYTTEPAFLSIRKADPPYFYAERKGRDSVALFLINSDKKVLIRWQPMPPISDDELFASPITGSIEENKDLYEIAIQEALEEGGYEVDSEMLMNLGEYIATTQMNEVVHMFYADVTFLPQVNCLGDGSYHETLASNEWMSFEAALRVAKYSGLLIGLFLLREKGLV